MSMSVKCVICDTRVCDDDRVSPGHSVNGVPVLTKTTMSQVSVISIINNIISITSPSSSVICSRCFNLLDTIDTLQVQLRFKKSEIVTLHKNKNIHEKDNDREKDPLKKTASEELKCQMCGKTFGNNGSLRNHRSKEHRNDLRKYSRY